MAFDQPLQNAVAEVEELGRAGVAEQPQVEDPQRERVLAAPGERGARGVEGGRGSAAEQVRRGGQLGWREVLDALPCGMPVSGPLTVDALDEVIALRGRANLEGSLAESDELSAAQLSHGLREMGAATGATLRVVSP